MKIRAAIIGLLSFLGMIDTLYLGMKRGVPVPCRITGGCENVLNSKFSEIGGIPISWFGFAFYLTVFSCAVFAATGDDRPLRLVFWPALAAFCVSLALVGIQMFVLESYCEYCLASALMVTSILVLSPFPRRPPS